MYILLEGCDHRGSTPEQLDQATVLDRLEGPDTGWKGKLQ